MNIIRIFLLFLLIVLIFEYNFFNLSINLVFNFLRNEFL